MAAEIEVDPTGLRKAAQHAGDARDGVDSVVDRVAEIVASLPQACGSDKFGTGFLAENKGSEFADNVLAGTRVLRQGCGVVHEVQLQAADMMDAAEEASRLGLS